MSTGSVNTTDDDLRARIGERTRRAESPDGCWEWTGGTVRVPGSDHRYPVVAVGGRMAGVRPLVYRLWGVGPALERGECVKDVCGNPACVRPDHLTLGKRGRPRKVDTRTAEWRRLVEDLGRLGDEEDGLLPREFRRRVRGLLGRARELLTRPRTA